MLVHPNFSSSSSDIHFFLTIFFIVSGRSFHHSKAQVQSTPGKLSQTVLDMPLLTLVSMVVNISWYMQVLLSFFLKYQSRLFGGCCFL